MTERIFVLKGRKMNNQNDSSTLDLFRERLASPFLFTFFWVSCTWNWKLIYWFLYEPLKPSLKFNQIPFEWFYLEPLCLALLIVAVMPWVNNFVEFLKRYAVNWFNQQLHKKNWKEMVSYEEHSSSLEELSTLKSRVYDLTNHNEVAKTNENKSREEVLTEINKNNSLLTELESAKRALSELLQEQNELRDYHQAEQDRHYRLLSLSKDLSSKLTDIDSEILSVLEKQGTMAAVKYDNLKFSKNALDEHISGLGKRLRVLK